MRYCNSVLCKVHNRKQTNQTRATSVTILMQDLLILIIQNYSLSWNVLYSLKNKNKEPVTLKNMYIKQWKQILLMHSCLDIWSTFMWLYRFLSLCSLQMHISQKPCHSDLHSYPSSRGNICFRSQYGPRRAMNRIFLKAGGRILYSSPYFCTQLPFSSWVLNELWEEFIGN